MNLSRNVLNWLALSITKMVGTMHTAVATDHHERRGENLNAILNEVRQR